MKEPVLKGTKKPPLANGWPTAAGLFVSGCAPNPVSGD